MTTGRGALEQRLDRVIDYVVSHLDEDLSLARLADLAAFSPFHFHRIFQSYLGEPPAMFVRRLRLEKAIGLMGRRRILTQVAVEVGFASSSDFSRAFREVYGFPPSKYRPGRLGEDSKIRQDMLVNRGYGFRERSASSSDEGFSVQIEEWPTMRMAYLRIIGSYEPAKMMATLDQLLDWGRARGIWPPARLVATSSDHPDITPAPRYRMDLGMLVPSGFAEDAQVGFADVAGGAYAVLQCQGDIAKVERAWIHLFDQWLPASGYEPDDRPAIELFGKVTDPPDWTTFDLQCALPIRPLSPL